MSFNKARPVPSSATRRNFFIVAAIIAIVALVLVWLFVKPPAKAETSQEEKTVAMPEILAIQENQAGSLNTPQKCAEVISDYYTSLASRDAAGLRRIGATDAANAVDLGWLDSIHYVVDTNKLASPASEQFPAGAGLYAGNIAYKISDFYPAGATDGAVSSDVTGGLPASGWIYFDSLKNSWVIADPTIPTAISAAEAPNIQRSSEDGLVNVKASCAGVLSSPWWSYAKMDINVALLDQNADVFVEVRPHDSGMTLDVSAGLLGQVPKAGQIVEGRETGKAGGSCVIRRGENHDFVFERIGATPLLLDGDLFPLDVNYHEENVAPFFPVGAATLASLQREVNYQQAVDYGVDQESLSEIGATIDEFSTENG